MLMDKFENVVLNTSKYSKNIASPLGVFQVLTEIESFVKKT
jgi:hypothetical protein